MDSGIGTYITDLQDNDPMEPALFRLLAKKSYRDHKEEAYINRYRTAFYLEVVALMNIPVAVYLLARSRPTLNKQYLSRKRCGAAGMFVLATQVNFFLAAQYFRKVKRYNFEDELMIKYHRELTTATNKSK